MFQANKYNFWHLFQIVLTLQICRDEEESSDDGQSSSRSNETQVYP